MKKTILTAVCSAFVITSCTNNEMPNNENDLSEKALKINATINSVKDTRAEKTAWANDDKLGLYICNDSLGTPYKSESLYSNAEFTFGSSGWTSSSILLDENEATVFAYYPYSSTLTTPTAVPVDVTTQTDYMYGKGASTASFANRNVNIDMKHALTQVVFKIKKTSDYTGTGSLTAIELSNLNSKENLCKSATMNISTGALAVSSPSDMSFSATSTLTAEAQSFSSILLPVSATAGKDIKVVFTIDGKDLQYIFPAGTAWAKGYRNIYSISLGSNGLTIGGADGSGVDIEVWTSTSPSDIELIPVI